MRYPGDDMDVMNAAMGMMGGGKGDPVLARGGTYDYFPFIPRAGTWNVDKHHMKRAKLKGPADPLMMMWNPFNPERWDDSRPSSVSPFMGTGSARSRGGRSGRFR